MDCPYCGKETDHIDRLYSQAHAKCTDELYRRKDAKLCVMCSEPLHDDVLNTGPGALRHQECIERDVWIGYDFL